MKTKTVAAAKEDPSIKAARDREERRADAAFLDGAKGLLDEETRRKIRKFGSRPAARAAAAAGSGAAAGAGSGSGSGSFDPGAFGGGRFGGGGGGSGDGSPFVMSAD